MLPALLRSEDSGVPEMVFLVAKNSSPKEVILALKELGESLTSPDDLDSDVEYAEARPGKLLPKHCALVIRIYTDGEARLTILCEG